MSETENALSEAENRYLESGGKEPLATEQPKEVEPVETKTEEVVEQKVEEQPKVVPLAALHEEREKRKARDKELMEFREKWAKAEGRLEALTAKLAPKEELVQLNPDEQPIDALKTTMKQVNDLADWQKQQNQIAQQQQHEAQFLNTYASAAQEFSSKQRDFRDAYNFIMQSRVAELQSLGWGQNEIAQIIANDEKGIAAKAFQDGVNPAERIYALAKTRGYAPKAEAKPEPKTEIETVAKGQKAADSLNGMPGAGVGNLSLKSIVEMDDDDFANLSDKDFRKLMGG